MATSEITEVIQFLGDCLKERGLDVSKIILFGSQMRGEAGDESDVDLVIVSKDFRTKDIFERVGAVRHAVAVTIKRFMVPLDVVGLTPEEFESESLLVARYTREGKVVYESKK